MSTQSNSDSDIEMKTIPLKKGKKKIPTSPTTEMLKEPRKLTTREMVTDALAELKSRKGVSYQAIKKHLVEKYQVDTEKMNFYIKKYLKSAVESGAIIQTKGVGATGSFRLAPEKKQIDKKNGKPEKKVMKMEKSKKADKVNKIKNEEKKSKVKTDENKIEKKSEMKNNTEHKSKKVKLNSDPAEKKKKQETKTALKTKKVTETVKSKGAKMATQTPAKKKMAMMKRKSIGSIIKPPKMKPKAN